MTSNNKFEGWVLVLNSVKTPLGFFTLLVLILDGVLLAMATLTEKISFLAPVGLLGLVIVLVFAIVWWKPYVLYHPRDWQNVTVNLLFLKPDPADPTKLQKVEAIGVALDVAQCILKVRDRKGRVKYQRTPNLTFNQGGWTLELTEDVGPSDSVRLELTERNGQQWEVMPFLPYRADKQVLQINKAAEG